MSSLFANPLLLAGLVAVLLPPLIEWLFRRRKRRVELPTLRYLLRDDAQKKVRRQDRLLLLLRCLACGLIALAVARPVWRSDAGDAADRPHLIALLDGTASMQQQVGVADAFARGKRRLLDLLDSLPEGSTATIGVLGNRLSVVAEHEEDLRSLADRVRALRAGAGAAPIATGLEWMNEVAAADPERDHECYIFSDFQGYTWLRDSTAGRRNADALAELQSYGRPSLVDVGADASYNFVLERFEPVDPLLAVGRTIRFACRVGSFGDPPPEQSVEATFLVDGEKKATRRLAGAGTVHFDYRFPAAGEYTLSVEIDGDRHLLDNRRRYLCEVDESVRILLLDAEAGEEGPQRDSWFLERAIAPPVRPGFDPVSRFAVTVVHPEQAAFQNFHDYAMVALLGPERLDERLAGKLAGYVKTGGAACLFVGPGVNPYEYNQHLSSAGGGMLPVSFAAPQRDEDHVLAFADHPSTALLGAAGPSPRPALRSFLPLHVQEGARVELIGRIERAGGGTDQGYPGIISLEHGLGRIAVFATGAGPESSSFPASTDFAVLMQELCRQLIGDPDADVNLEVGDRFEQPVLVSTQQLLLRGPDGYKARLTPQVAGEEQFQLRFEDTGRVGLYEVDTIPEVLERRRFVVNLDSAESDLTRVGEAELAASLGGGWQWVGAERSLVALGSSRYSVTELGGILLVVLVAMLLVESYLAMRFGRRRSARSAEGAQ